MIDIRFVRDNPELVKEKAKQKGYVVDIGQLLGFDKKRAELQQKVENLRRQRNELADSGKSGNQTPVNIDRARALKQELSDLEHQFVAVDKEFLELLKQVPNMPHDSVAVGASEAENQVSKEWGEKPQFDFEPKTHWEIAESRDWIDKVRASKVTGSRFAYIKGDLVRLQFAILQFVMDTLTSQESVKKIIQDFGVDVVSKPFKPVLPPALIKEEVFDAMDRLEPRDDRYQVGMSEDKLWLQGSAEHTLGPIYMDEIIPESELPMRYLGFLTSFRREAGTYGKDTEGIIRMHQFDKAEMESFTMPEHGFNEHLFMVAIQEYLMQQLRIPYHVLKKCTADIGKPNASGVDIEAWLPGNKRFLETHTADFMTDYQARRLSSRARRQNGEIVLINTNDATAFAMGRTMVAIIENYQTKDGSVNVPEALQKYMQGQNEI